jgi:hypothetical protein
VQALGGDVDSDHAPRLIPLSVTTLDPSLLADARVVVLIVIDGYGGSTSADGASLAALSSQPPLSRTLLTSVFPSTTAAALTSLQTGVAPGQHGVAGYTLYLPEARRVVNMIQFTAVDGSSLPSRVGDPTGLLRVPTIYDRLAELGTESVVVSHVEYAKSPLTLLHSGDTPYRGHRTVAEFAMMLRHEAQRPGRRFVFGYWAGVDMLAHTYGPGSAEVALEAMLIEQALARGFLNPLAEGDDDVVVIVTADHGLVETREEDSESLGSIATSAGRFKRPPTGERRVVGLSIPDSEHRDRVAERIGNRGVIVGTSDAAVAGLFGPQPLHDDLVERIGDSMLIARDGHSFPFRPLRTGGSFALGAHGSLTPEEMLVPMLVWRFGR